MYEKEFGEIVYTKAEKEVIDIKESNNYLRGYLPERVIQMLTDYALLDHFGLVSYVNEPSFIRESIWSKLKPFDIIDDNDDEEDEYPDLPILNIDDDTELVDESTPYFPTIEDILNNNRLNFKQKKVSFEKENRIAKG